MMFGLEKLTAKAIGVGVLAVVLILCVIGLINYGTKLGRAQVEIERLEGEVKEANAWKAEVLTRLDNVGASIDANVTVTNDAFTRYEELILLPPHTVTSWREVAADVPTTVRLGDCDAAAVDAWDVLKAAGLIGENTWEDTSYVSPLRPGFYQDAARLDRLLTPPTFELYLSTSVSHPLRGSVGMYHLSPSPTFPVMR